MNRIGLVVVAGFFLFLFTLISTIVEAAERVFTKVGSVLAPALDLIGKGLELIGVEGRFWSYCVFLFLSILIIRALWNALLN